MQKNKNNIKLIVKSNELNHFTFYKSSVQLKVFSKLILEIRNNPNLNIYRVQISDLLKEINYHEKDYKKLKETIRKMGQMVEIPQERGFHLETLFYRINTKDCTYLDFEVNPHLKPYLLDLSSNFTSYLFENITNLKSQYSIRLYELLKQFEKGGFWKKTIVEIREILKIESNQYIRYNDFKKDIIIKAQKELEEKTDIKFTFEEHKTGRKIEMITFYISKNNKNISPLTIEAKTQEPQQKEPTEEEKKLIEFREKEAYKILTKELKITEKSILTYLKNYDIETIESNAIYTLNKLKKGEIKKSASGYFSEALKNNRAEQINDDISSKEYKEKEQKAREEKEKKERKKIQLLEKLEKDYQDDKKDFLNNFINTETPLLNDYIEQYRQALINKEITTNLTKISKRDLSSIESLKELIHNDHFLLINFRVFLAPKILPKELLSVEEYIKSKI